MIRQNLKLLWYNKQYIIYMYLNYYKISYIFINTNIIIFEKKIR
jgi:hypothetical protein